MAKFNPDYLLSDELTYEALLRDYPSDVNVAALRKSLRGSSQEKHVDLTNLTKLNFSDEVQLCTRKYQEIVRLSENVQSERSSSAILRLYQRVNHLIRRINNLIVWPERDELPPSTKSFIDSALVELPRIARVVKKISDSFTSEELLEQDPSNDDRDSREVKSLVAMECNLSGMQVPPVSVSKPDPQVSTLPINMFGKITHPIEKFLTQIPCTDGLDIPNLLMFIKILMNLKNLPNLSDTQTLGLLIPYVVPPLRTKIQDSVQCGQNIDQLHSTLIHHFIPTGVYHQLVSDKVRRVQKVGELLGHYIADIKEHADILRAPFSERELIDLMLLGLNPAERSRLVFMPRPATFNELDQLCMHSANVHYSDSQREYHDRPQQGHDGGGSAGVHLSLPLTGSNSRGRNFRRYDDRVVVSNRHYASNPQAPRICYKCGGSGHLRRECRYPGASYPKNV